MVLVDYAAVFSHRSLSLGFGMKDCKAFRGSIKKRPSVKKSLSDLVDTATEFVVGNGFCNVINDCDEGVKD